MTTESERAKNSYSPPLRHGVGNTITLTAEHASGKWWISKNGRLASTGSSARSAVKDALRHEPRRDIAIVYWKSPPDSSVPREFETCLPLVEDWLHA